MMGSENDLDPRGSRRSSMIYLMREIKSYISSLASITENQTYTHPQKITVQTSKYCELFPFSQEKLVQNSSTSPHT
jgi:hypothetical protein